MQFLKTLFWIVLTVIAVAFAFKNWTPVTVLLWGNIVVDVKLPILLFAAFLLGLLPMFVLHRASRWRLRRKLDHVERSLAETRLAETDAAPAEREPALPPGATPMAVPPAL
jgi:lipopolysaccharide assembly protein A